MAGLRLTRPGHGTGKLTSMFYNEQKGAFSVTVRHKAGVFDATTPVELEPGELATVLFSQLIPGWLAEPEARLLFRLAKEAIGPIVEVGSFAGKSTVCLGWGAKLAGHRMWAVDPHQGSAEWAIRRLQGKLGTFPAWRMNMNNAGLQDGVTPLVTTSAQAVREFEDETLGLVFIDGDHNEADRDFDLWFPKLMPEGLVLFHDSDKQHGDWPLVREAVQTRIHDNVACSFMGSVVTITIGKKELCQK